MKKQNKNRMEKLLNNQVHNKVWHYLKKKMMKFKKLLLKQIKKKMKKCKEQLMKKIKERMMKFKRLSKKVSKFKIPSSFRLQHNNLTINKREPQMLDFQIFSMLVHQKQGSHSIMNRNLNLLKAGLKLIQLKQQNIKLLTFCIFAVISIWQLQMRVTAISTMNIKFLLKVMKKDVLLLDSLICSINLMALSG